MEYSFGTVGIMDRQWISKGRFVVGLGHVSLGDAIDCRADECLILSGET
ncbi:MAG: hypothetical protein GVY17_02215 [Cyanobacteria bacterium]|nr:hypothetical protein [Cyanobacteria bacterium GSL.Bin21]